MKDKGYKMTIKDLIKVQKKDGLFKNCASVLRYIPRELLFDGREADRPELTLGLERQLIHEKDWKDASDESKKELDVIHACMDVAKVIEIHKDPESTASKEERCGVLLTHLMKECNFIRTSTRRCAGNYILINNAFKKELEELDAFSTPFINVSTDNTEYLVNGVIKMSVATFDEDTPMALIGYSGTSRFDGGIVLAEDEENNKYAIADRFYDSDKYYRLIKLV